jgi:hypothetical protein
VFAKTVVAESSTDIQHVHRGNRTGYRRSLARFADELPAAAAPTGSGNAGLIGRASPDQADHDADPLVTAVITPAAGRPLRLSPSPSGVTADCARGSKQEDSNPFSFAWSQSAVEGIVLVCTLKRFLRSSAALALVLLGACINPEESPASKLASVQVGMTREEVVALLGAAQMIEHYGDTEFLFYSGGGASSTALSDYTPIAIVDGRVTGTGREIYNAMVEARERKSRPGGPR